MAIVAVSVFVIAYALIATERIHKVKVALGGAAVVLSLGIVSSDDVFYSHETGIDWDVIFLLLGTMVMVGVLRQTGGFEYAAIWAAKRAGGSPLRVMILLVLITAIASAALPNVTIVTRPANDCGRGELPNATRTVRASVSFRLTSIKLQLPSGRSTAYEVTSSLSLDD